MSALTPITTTTSSSQGVDSTSSTGQQCVFEGGADTASALAPAYASMVLEGPGGVAGSVTTGSAGRSGVDDVAREQRVAWRQRRQRALLALGQV